MIVQYSLSLCSAAMNIYWYMKTQIEIQQLIKMGVIMTSSLVLALGWSSSAIWQPNRRLGRAIPSVMTSERRLGASMPQAKLKKPRAPRKPPRAKAPLRVVTDKAAGKTPQKQTSPCPSCGQAIRGEGWRRHLAYCAPDLLDPEGWESWDRDVVLRHAARRYRKGSAEAKAIALRFGVPSVTSQQQVATQLGWTARRTRDTIAQLLHAIPPVPDPSGVDVLFEDSWLIAVNKPAGVGVTPEHRWRPGSMLNRVIAHVGPRRARDMRPVHRLDLNTSGVLLFAKEQRAATALMRQFEQREVRKAYAAIGSALPRLDVVDSRICRVEGVEHCERRVCEPQEEGGQTARTELAVVGSSAGDAAAGPCLMIARPQHGRTHQIRVHCLAAGAPLVADSLYGGMALPALQRHALHALSLVVAHPVTGKRLEICAPLAGDMYAALRQLRIELPAGDSSTSTWSAREGAALRKAGGPQGTVL